MPASRALMRMPSSHALLLTQVTEHVPASHAAGRQEPLPWQSRRQAPPEHATAPVPEPHARSPVQVVVLVPARTATFAQESALVQVVSHELELQSSAAHARSAVHAAVQLPASQASALHESVPLHFTLQALPEQATARQERAPSQMVAHDAAFEQSTMAHVSLPRQSIVHATPAGHTTLPHVPFAAHVKAHAPASVQAPPASPHVPRSHACDPTATSGAASRMGPPSTGSGPGGGSEGPISSPASGARASYVPKTSSPHPAAMTMAVTPETMAKAATREDRNMVMMLTQARGRPHRE
jgi:hypothetical protein